MKYLSNIGTTIKVKLNKVSKYVFVLTNIFLFSALSLTKVLAADGQISNPLGDLKTLAGILNRILAFLIPIAVVGFTLCIFYAAYIRLFSSGDSGKEKESFAIARNAAIGFFIIFLAGISLQLFGGFLKIDI